MAKKKKKKVQPTLPVIPELTSGQYYWCVNCGHHGDYGFHRKKSIKCEVCEYNDVTLWTLEDINDPFLDNLNIEDFKTKKQAIMTVDNVFNEKAPASHKKHMAAVEEAKVLLDKYKTESKPKGKSIIEKLKEIRKL